MRLTFIVINFIWLLTAIAAILLLSGCSTVVPVPEKVFVEISRPCLTADQVPQSGPVSTDAELAAMPDFGFVIALAADRLTLRQHNAELSAAIKACVR